MKRVTGRSTLHVHIPALWVVTIMISSCPASPRSAPARAPVMGYAAYDPTLDGARQIEEATAAARRSGRRVLVMFGGNWCVWCRALDALFTSEPAVRAQLQHAFVLVHVDSDSNVELNRRYDNAFQHGFPVLLVLGGAGELIHVQPSGSLERGDGTVAHDPGRVLAFLQRWSSPG